MQIRSVLVIRFCVFILLYKVIPLFRNAGDAAGWTSTRPTGPRGGIFGTLSGPSAAQLQVPEP